MVIIAYRAGMMGSIPNDVRGGLLELFYGVYEKDPDRCSPPASHRTCHCRGTTEAVKHSMHLTAEIMRSRLLAKPSSHLWQRSTTSQRRMLPGSLS